MRDHVPSTVGFREVFTSYVRGPVPVAAFQEKFHEFAEIDVLFGRRLVGTEGPVGTVVVFVTLARGLHALKFPRLSCARTCQYQIPGVAPLKNTEVAESDPEEKVPVVSSPEALRVGVIEVIT